MKNQPRRHCIKFPFAAFKGMFFGATVLLVVAMFAISAYAVETNLSPAFCDALIKHTPNADVAYQPGIDIEGNKVAPADLPDQPQIKMPEKIQIPLTVNLAKTLNLNVNAYPTNQLGQGTEATLGIITIEGDKVMLNGKEISGAQQDRLAVLCLHPKGGSK